MHTLSLHAHPSLHMCINISGEVSDRISILLFCLTSLISQAGSPCVLTSLIFSPPFIIWSLYRASTPVEPNVLYTQQAGLWDITTAWERNTQTGREVDTHTDRVTGIQNWKEDMHDVSMKTIDFRLQFFGVIVYWKRETIEGNSWCDSPQMSMFVSVTNHDLLCMLDKRFCPHRTSVLCVFHWACYFKRVL